MALPAAAKIWAGKLDPSDHLDYYFELHGEFPLLETDENVDSFILFLPPEAVALGLIISDEVGREPSIVDIDGQPPAVPGDGVRLKIWLSIDEDFRSDAAFEGGGIQLPVTLTVISDAVPSRTRQRTALVQVLQQ